MSSVESTPSDLEDQATKDETPQTTSKPFEPPRKKRPNSSFLITFAGLNLCVFISTVNTINLASALPAIATDLSATTSQAFWTSIVLLFVQCVAQPIYGTLAEILGRKPCMVAALAIFALASLFAALAPNIECLIAARALQGAGTGGINVCVNVLIVDLVPQRQRAKMSGLVSLAGAVGLVAGVLTGSALSLKSWRLIFYVNLPLSVVPIVLFVFFLDDKRQTATEKGGAGWGWTLQQLKGMDWTGIVIFSASISAILFAIVTAGGNGNGDDAAGWSSPQILAPLILGIVSLGCFIAFEEMVAGKIRGFGQAFIPMRLFSRRTAAFGFLVTFLHAMILWAIPYYYLLYLNISASKSLLQASVLVLPSTFVIPIAAATAGILMSRLSHFKYFNAVAFALMVAGCGCLSTLGADPSLGPIIGFQFLFSIGGGILFPGRLVAVQAAQRELPGGKRGEEDRSDVRMATSLVSFMTSLGQAFGIAMGSTSLQSAWDALVNDAAHAGLLAGPDGEVFLVPGQQAAKSADVVALLPPLVAAQYRDIAARSIARVWYVCTGLAVLGFVVAAASRNLSLQSKHEEHAVADRGEEPELVREEASFRVAKR